MLSTDDHVDLLTLEICTGVGMLGEGLRAGLAHMGLTTRPVCYVEREAYATAVLAARIQEGSLDAAPVWSDLLTFDSRAWRGAVDCVVAGFPCQDLSLAGRRDGLDGKRSSLFFNILDIADDCCAQFFYLENVSGIASASATVVDQAAAAEITGERYRPAGDALGEPDGVVLERAAARVLGELADRGWHAEWLTLSASEVGASHGRARWFCFAWRQLDNTNSDGTPKRQNGRRSHDEGSASGWLGNGVSKGHEVLVNTRSIRRNSRRMLNGEHDRHQLDAASAIHMGHTGLQHQHLQQRQDGAEHPAAGQPVADASSRDWRELTRTNQRGLSQPDGRTAESPALGHTHQQRTHRSGSPGQQAGCDEPAQSGGCAADTDSNGFRASRRTECQPSDIASGGSAVANTSSPRPQIRTRGG